MYINKCSAYSNEVGRQALRLVGTDLHELYPVLIRLFGDNIHNICYSVFNGGNIAAIVTMNGFTFDAFVISTALLEHQILKDK